MIEEMRPSTILALCAALAACKTPAPIAKDTIDAGTMKRADAPDAQADASDASADAEADASDDPDACVPGDTWEAKVRVRNTWHPMVNMTMQGPLEVFIPRTGARATIFQDCGTTGGGCGDCSKPYAPDHISCKLEPGRARVDVGLDDIGPTHVDVVQRGDTVYADWTWGGIFDPTDPNVGSRKESKVLLKLPCSVKLRFVR